MRSFLKKLEEKPLEPLVLRLLAAWCLTACVYIYVAGGDFTKLEQIAATPLWMFFLLFAAAFGLLLLCGRRRGVKSRKAKKRARAAAARAEAAAGAETAAAEPTGEPDGAAALPAAKPAKSSGGRVALPVCFALYTGFSLLMNPDFYFAFMLTVFWAILIFYYDRRGYIAGWRRGPFSGRGCRRALWISAAVFVLAVGGTGVLRYLDYRAPNFDFGIFCQMFYSLKTKLVPVTTCERDALLSHFAVHISPVYYLLLPVYFLFPSPLTLQLSQAVLLASAVIPLTRLCRVYALSDFKTAAMGVLLLAYPAVAGGTNYDFHENCFLLPLLLWVFCLYEEKRWLPMGICVALTLLVKEDAAVYIIFFALFVLLDRKQYGVGALLIAGAGVYFVGALFLLRTFGDGVMEGRYANYIVNDGGLAEAVKNVLADPGYAFTQILVDKDGDVGPKVLFLLQMLLPLAFLPFTVRRTSRLLLLLPMLLLNLLTLYAYQFDIGYQYTFGVTAFVFYLSVLNLSDLPRDTARRMLLVALVCGTLCFFAGPMDRFVTYSAIRVKNAEEIRLLGEAFAEIPDDASVAASAYFTPHLSKRDALYEVYYHKPQPGERLDYVLLDLRFDYERFIGQYEKWGYTVTKTVSCGGKDILAVMEWAGEN